MHKIYLSTSALGTLISLESTRNNQIALQLQTTDKKKFQTFELIKKTAVICFAFGFRAEWMNFKGWLEEVIKCKKTKTNGVHQKFNTIQIEYFKM